MAGFVGGWAAMSTLGASRFTAVLAAIAISGMAGTFWWALKTRSDMKAAVGNQEASRTLPLKGAGHASRSKDDRPGKLEYNKSEQNKFEQSKFELMGKSERSLPAPLGRSSDQDQTFDRPMPPPMLATFRNPDPASSPAPVIPGAQSRSLQSQPLQGSGADMPLPALPALAPSDPAPWQARAPDPPMFLPPLPAPSPPPENPKRQIRDARPGPPATSAAARAPKPSAQQQPSYYTEKFVEQGEYRYRRRLCEPPNMPDVCFMPQADRQPIVIAKP
jgi:hypothetical protein